MESESVVSQVQRKIELQSPEDLAYLVANVRNAAAVQLNEAFPHVEGHDGEDELRNQIEALVDEYINSTFSFATPNLSINGLSVTPDSFLNSSSASASDPGYQAFDTRKRRRVADLITQEEKLLEEVAALKRSVPSVAAAEQAESMRTTLKQDDESLAQCVAKAASGSVDLEVAELERQNVVEGEFKTAVETLGRLKREMPAVVAKMERARIAGEYVVTQGR